MKYVVLAAVLFLLGIAVTQMKPESEPLIPVVRVRTDNGLFMTMVERPRNKHAACASAVQDLVTELGKACATCTVESTECSARLRGVDETLWSPAASPLYIVAAEEIRIGLIGPPESVKAKCESMAAVMADSGVKSACIAPAAPS